MVFHINYFQSRALCILVLLVIILNSAGCMNSKQASAAGNVNDQLALAVKYLSDDNFDQAILAFETAIEIDPKSTPAYKGLSAVHRIQGDIEEAQDTLLKGIKLAENPDELKVELADDYQEQGKYREAAELYDQLLAKDYLQNDERAWQKAAYGYSKVGNYSKAIGLLEEGFKLFLSDRFQVALAELYALNGESDKSLSLIEQLLEKDINMGEVYLILNVIFKNNAEAMMQKGDELLLADQNSVLGNILKITALAKSGAYDDLYAGYEDYILSGSNIKLKLYLVGALLETSSSYNSRNLLASIDVSKITDPFILTDMAFYQLYFNRTSAAEELLEIAVYNVLDTKIYFDRIKAEYSSNEEYEEFISIFTLLLAEKEKQLLKEETIQFLEESLSSSVKFNITQVDTSKLPVITAYFSVNDYLGNPVDKELASSKFKFFNNYKLVNGDFSLADNKWTKVPIQIILVLDVSTSMRGEPLEQVKIAAKEFVKLMNKNTKIGIVTFGGDVNVITKLTSNKNTLFEKINEIEVYGNTPLHYGTAEGIDMLRNTFGRKVVIVMADGENNQGECLEEVLESANQNNVSIYTIGLGDLRPDDLSLMAGETGGQFYETPNAEDLSGLYERILDQVKNEYKFTFVDNIIDASSQGKEGFFEIFYGDSGEVLHADRFYTIEEGYNE